MSLYRHSSCKWSPVSALWGYFYRDIQRTDRELHHMALITWSSISAKTHWACDVSCMSICLLKETGESQISCMCSGTWPVKLILREHKETLKHGCFIYVFNIFTCTTVHVASSVSNITWIMNTISLFVTKLECWINIFFRTIWCHMMWTRPLTF